MTTNSFKSAMVAAIAVGASVTAGATSANAFTIGGNVSFDTSFNPPPPVVTAEFSNETVVGVDSDFSPAGTLVNVSALPLTVPNIGNNTASHPLIPSFISGFQYQGTDAVFDLLVGSDTFAFSNALGTVAADLSFHGLIKSTTGDLLANVTGTFSGTQSATNDDFSIDLSATPVPTPALLPGLLGLGMGIVRKRKSQSEAAA